MDGSPQELKERRIGQSLKEIKDRSLFVSGIPAMGIVSDVINFFKKEGVTDLLTVQRIIIHPGSQNPFKKGVCLLYFRDLSLRERLLNKKMLSFCGRLIQIDVIKDVSQIGKDLVEQASRRVLIKKVPKNMNGTYLNSLLERKFGKIEHSFQYFSQNPRTHYQRQSTLMTFTFSVVFKTQSSQQKAVNQGYLEYSQMEPPLQIEAYKLNHSPTPPLSSSKSSRPSRSSKPPPAPPPTPSLSLPSPSSNNAERSILPDQLVKYFKYIKGKERDRNKGIICQRDRNTENNQRNGENNGGNYSKYSYSERGGFGNGRGTSWQRGCIHPISLWKDKPTHRKYHTQELGERPLYWGSMPNLRLNLALRGRKRA